VRVHRSTVGAAVGRGLSVWGLWSRRGNANGPGGGDVGHVTYSTY
jgi:hypothetical protein